MFLFHYCRAVAQLCGARFESATSSGIKMWAAGSGKGNKGAGVLIPVCFDWGLEVRSGDEAVACCLFEYARAGLPVRKKVTKRLRARGSGTVAFKPTHWQTEAKP
jgi:hypothetical protein